MLLRCGRWFRCQTAISQSDTYILELQSDTKFLELDAGLLRIVHSVPMPPPMVYNAVFHQGTLDGRSEYIARRAAEVCDFSRRRNVPASGIASTDSQRKNL